MSWKANLAKRLAAAGVGAVAGATVGGGTGIVGGPFGAVAGAGIFTVGGAMIGFFAGPDAAAVIEKVAEKVRKR